ncbi:MAG TPA: hypothetical protein G4O10_06885 [Dehalococcoidia bacterium]|nr:hypothetical protein [Dehalococcoidia bacterium]
MKNLLIAIGILILCQSYFMIPGCTPEALNWILFAVLLLFGIYTIYSAMQTEK